ncbi:hypothetical protein QWZ14_30690 [Paeniroseomonas aquatica]|uniref:Uncharacterized protein n=1 Tax=Paeniroseomonas aquatica TaxID=373043 RepID=A0ABT8AGU6_9PROT|nr:hypothetical protein [Paeniroseomonas aquatica]MDN3568766.1 hypothetical protein [Paeniroseomonas aquatica]
MKSSRPWLLVREPDYFKGVIGSMVKFDSKAKDDPAVVARFGRMGHGVQPNYQLEAPPHRVRAHMGGGHKPDATAPGGRYADVELSERFTLKNVQALLRRCLDIQSGKIDPGPDGEGAWP